MSRKKTLDSRTKVLLALCVAMLSVVGVLNAACSSGGVKEAKPQAHDPFVQSVSSSSAVIAWVSDRPSVGSLGYGDATRLRHEKKEDRTDTRHAITLSGLRADSTYYYRVSGTGGAPKVASFRTAPDGPDSGFTFAVIGDSGSGTEDQSAVATLLERIKPDLILHTGDVVYESGAEQNYDPRFFTPYRRLIKGVPIFPTLGNHDVETDDGSPYLKNFYLPHDNPQHTERYYSFDWGNAHFVALDSELYYDDKAGSPEEQKTWLEHDLSATHQPWKFVFFHRPPYSSSKHGSDEKIRKDLQPIFERYKVNIVFNGHDHDYERTVPIHGVTYVVTGGGGSEELYPAGKSEWTAFSKSVYHATLVRIDGDLLSLEAVEPDGTLIDRSNLELR